MSTLKLTLAPVENNKELFRIRTQDFPEENSKLPYFDDNDNNIYTIISVLNAIDSKYSFDKDDNLDWMIKEGLLDGQDNNFFHPKMRENIASRLYQALFPGNIKTALERKLGDGKDLHIQIEYDFTVSGNSSLSLYPWHLVHDGNDFLAKSGVTFSYRIVHHKSLPPGKRQIDQLKVLVISSQASENHETRLKDQESLINDSLKKAQDEGRACLLSWYEPRIQKPTYKLLEKYFTVHRQKEADKFPDIVHFNGHGVFKKKCHNPLCPKRDTHEIFYHRTVNRCTHCQTPLRDGTGFLLFEDEQGKPDYISAEDFADLIEICSPKPQLIVITACKAALAHKSASVFNGVAQKLLQKVPAVVATPFTISQDSTTDFIEQFYRVLGNGKSSLLEAVKFASQAMKYKEYEWYRLMLFLRHNGDENGYLFEFQETIQQLFSQENRELEQSDIETLKDLLKRCQIITSNRIVRKQFCQSIGIEIDDISPDGVAGLNDNLFIYTLLDYLERTDNKSAVYKICVKIEPHFKSSVELTNKLQAIKNKI